MKWIEQIRVRSSPSALRAAMPAVQQHLRSLADSAPQAETFFLQHALYDGDLAVVVVWQSEDPPSKSREGLLVAEHLRQLGSVDHTVWQPVEDFGV